MGKTIDAKGLQCPMPVILAKKEMDAGEAFFKIAVDNHPAVENLQRLADSQGYRTIMESGTDGVFQLEFIKADHAAVSMENIISDKPQTGNWSVFIGKDILGGGDAELGLSLMKMYFYTLAQGSDLPASILFMNAGVKLPVQDEQIVEHLRLLANKGVEILVCGTCLNFYGIAEQLQVGTVSNMYEISERMQRAEKVISL